MKRTTINSIVLKNLDVVKKFFVDNFSVKLSSNSTKLSTNCPYCEKVDHNHHLVINLDWGVVKCFRCGIATSIISFLKKEGKAHEYFTLLEDVSDLSLFELQSLFRSDYVSVKKVNDSNNIDYSSEFIKKNGLIPAEKIREALRFAAIRTRKNIEEISTYYADEKYLYIPIFKDRRIIAFIARRYIEEKDIPRYRKIKFTNDEPVAFLDEVIENISSNTIYITEGYFDAFSINASLGEYCAIAILSKSDTYYVLDTLIENIPPETNIVIALDSLQKDDQIYSSIDMLYNKLKGSFSNIRICLFSEQDPGYIFENYGPKELVKQLRNNTLSSIEYFKKQTMKDRRKNDDDTEEPIQLPDFLLNLKKREGI